MNIFSEIKYDHKELKNFLKRLSVLESNETLKKQELFEQFKLWLKSHSEIEEKILYKPLISGEESRASILVGYEEHHLMDVLLLELAAMNIAHERWSAKLEVLRENLEHHIEEEEDTIFKKALTYFKNDKEIFVELGNRFHVQLEELRVARRKHGVSAINTTKRSKDKPELEQPVDF